jgi:peptide/nickel transport system permease protein
MLRRLLQSALVLFIVITLNFFLPRLMPGDPAQRFYESPEISSEQKKAILKAYGLDRPLIEQYGLYLRELAHGNLMMSFHYRRPVAQIIASRVPWTLALTLSSLLLSLFIGTALGAYAAWRRGSWIDYGVISLAILFSAVPSFWFAMILILLFYFSWNVLPGMGMTDPSVRAGLNLPYLLSIARHALLPVTVLTVIGLVSYATLVRSSMTETLGQDYVVVARAKGLAERVLLFKHVLRNALLPLVTSLGMRVAGLIGGVVVIEKVFSWQGMGLLLLDAAAGRDYPLMQGAFLVLAVLTILGNLLADVLLVFVDPRVKLR